MASVKPRPYMPDVAISPGATILEMLADMGITQAGLADRMNRPANKVNEILHGKRAITPDTALELELVLGIPAYVWLELESNYQIANKRLSPKAHAGAGRIAEDVSGSRDDQIRVDHKSRDTPTAGSWPAELLWHRIVLAIE